MPQFNYKRIIITQHHFFPPNFALVVLTYADNTAPAYSAYFAILISCLLFFVLLSDLKRR